MSSELADPRTLSIPRDLAGAYHRASANISRSAANYELVLVAVVSASLLVLGRPVVYYQLIVLCSLFAWRRKSFTALFIFVVVTLLRFDDAANVVAVSLPVALLAIVSHAALHHLDFPAGIEEEAGGGGVGLRRDKPAAMSKYGTFPASSSTALPPEGSFTASIADDAPWRALSVPRGFSEARRCLMWWQPTYLFVVIACFSVWPGKVFLFLLAFTPFLLAVTGAAVGVLALLAAGLLLIAGHAVLHVPADDGVDDVDEEAGRVDEPEQPLAVS